VENVRPCAGLRLLKRLVMSVDLTSRPRKSVVMFFLEFGEHKAVPIANIISPEQCREELYCSLYSLLLEQNAGSQTRNKSFLSGE
jgi:hypothetical protein